MLFLWYDWMMDSQKQAAISFLNLATTGHVAEAFDSYAAPNFKHHNPYSKGDAASLRIGMEDNHAHFPNKQFNIITAIEEGNTVITHAHLKLAEGGPEMAVVHIFRFENGKIAELWDVGQLIPEKNPNENGMF